MHRIRTDTLVGGKEVDVRFEPLVFGEGEDRHYRVEIKVPNLENVRELHHEGRLIGIRMHGTPPGRARQRSIIKPEETLDFDVD